MHLTRVLLLIAVTAVMASAMPVVTFYSTASGGHTGTMSYPGNGVPMTGSNIDIDYLIGTGTSANASVPGGTRCFGCTLSFVTGTNISDVSAGGTAWSFNGGGSFQVFGGFDLNGNNVLDVNDIPSGTLLLSGIFNTPVTVVTPTAANGSFINDLKFTSATLINQFDNRLDNFYGITGQAVYSGLYTQTFVAQRTQYAPGRWSFGPSTTNPAFTPMKDGQIVNTLALPEPMSILLFGTTGAILAGVMVRRRKRA